MITEPWGEGLSGSKGPFRGDLVGPSGRCCWLICCSCCRRPLRGADAPPPSTAGLPDRELSKGDSVRHWRTLLISDPQPLFACVWESVKPIML